MFHKNLFSVISLALFVFIGNTAFAGCPSADLNGDCFVDYEDFAQMGGQWLNAYDRNDLTDMAIQWLTTDPCVLDVMAYIPDGEFEMGRHLGEGYDDERPVHAVLVDEFFMSKYEITNQQYCDYLNDANSLGLIEVRSGVVYASPGGTDPYCDSNSYDDDSQIDYSGGIFSVRTKAGRDMSDDPMVEVSWYGAASYCNWKSSQEGYESCYNLSTWECDFSKHGYRLPTEAEREYAARGGQHNPYYRFPWGDTISHSQANYNSFWEGGSPYYPYDVSPTEGSHPDWDDGIWPITSVVGSFAANGYGLYDMTGNVWEWCNDWYDSNYYNVSPYDNPEGPVSGTYRVMRGGAWNYDAYYSRVAYRDLSGPDNRSFSGGFRIVLSD